MTKPYLHCWATLAAVASSLAVPTASYASDPLDDCNVDFKLHAPGKTVLDGSVRNGKVAILKVEPESRRKDIQFVGDVSAPSGRGVFLKQDEERSLR